MPAPKYTKKQWDAFSKDVGGEKKRPSKAMMDKYYAFEDGEKKLDQELAKKHGKRGEFEKEYKYWDARDKSSQTNFRSLFTEAEADAVLAESERREDAGELRVKAKRLTKDSAPLFDYKPKAKKSKGSTSAQPAEMKLSIPDPYRMFSEKKAKPRRRPHTTASQQIRSRLGGPEPAVERKGKVITSKVQTGYEVEDVPLPSEAGTRTMASEKKTRDAKRRAADIKEIAFLRSAAVARKVREARRNKTAMPSKKQTRDQRRKAVAASRMLSQGSQPESFEDFLAAITGEPQGEIRQMQRYQPAPMSMPELLPDPMLQEKPMQRHRLEMPQPLPRAQPAPNFNRTLQAGAGQAMQTAALESRRNQDPRAVARSQTAFPGVGPAQQFVTAHTPVEQGRGNSSRGPHRQAPGSVQNRAIDRMQQGSEFQHLNYLLQRAQSAQYDHPAAVFNRQQDRRRLPQDGGYGLAREGDRNQSRGDRYGDGRSSIARLNAPPRNLMAQNPMSEPISQGPPPQDFDAYQALLAQLQAAQMLQGSNHDDEPLNL